MSETNTHPFLETAPSTSLPRSRKRSFAYGVILAYAGQALMLVTGLCLTPFLVQRVGPNDYGLWLITTQLLGYLSLLDLGVLAIFPRELAGAAARVRSGGGYAKAATVFHEFWVLVLWQTPFVLAGCLVLWLCVPKAWLPFERPLLIFLATFVVLFPLRIFSSVLYAMQDQLFHGLLAVGTWLAGTALTLFLVFRGERLSAFIAGWALTHSLVVIFAAIRVFSRFPEVVAFRGAPVKLMTVKKYLKQSSWISAGQLGSVFLGGSDIAVLGRMLGPGAVVPYAMTGKLMGVARHLPNQLMHSAFPGLAEARAGESKEKLVEVVVALAQLLLLFSGGIVCVILAVNQTFVSWWVGENLFGGGMLTLLLVVDMLLRHCTTCLAFALFSFGREREFTLFSLADGVFTIALSILFCWGLGPVGIPLGSIVSACVIGLPLNFGVLASELFTNAGALIKPFYPLFWRLASAVLVILLGLRHWSPSGPLEAAFLALGVGAVYLALMRPVISNGPLRKYCPPRYRRLFALQ